MSYIAPPIPEAWKCSLTAASYSSDAIQQFTLKYGDQDVFNLDKIASGYVRGLNGDRSLSSADALLKDKNGELYFIEFKNQPRRNINSNEVQAKALSSLLVSQVALYPNVSLHEMSEKSHFYVIFKDTPDEEPDYFQKTAEKFGAYAGMSDEILWFDLRKHLEKGLYKDIHTISLSVFESKYSKSIFE